MFGSVKLVVLLIFIEIAVSYPYCVDYFGGEAHEQETRTTYDMLSCEAFCGKKGFLVAGLRLVNSGADLKCHCYTVSEVFTYHNNSVCMDSLDSNPAGKCDSFNKFCVSDNPNKMMIVNVQGENYVKYLLRTITSISNNPSTMQQTYSGKATNNWGFSFSAASSLDCDLKAFSYCSSYDHDGKHMYVDYDDDGFCNIACGDEDMSSGGSLYTRYSSGACIGVTGTDPKTTCAIYDSNGDIQFSEYAASSTNSLKATLLNENLIETQELTSSDPIYQGICGAEECTVSYTYEKTKTLSIEFSYGFSFSAEYGFGAVSVGFESSFGFGSETSFTDSITTEINLSKNGTENFGYEVKEKQIRNVYELEYRVCPIGYFKYYDEAGFAYKRGMGSIFSDDYCTTEIVKSTETYNGIFIGLQ